MRYRLARQAAGAADGRAHKPFAAAPWAEAIAHWMTLATGRGMNGRALYEWLAAEHGYRGSYKAIQRHVRAHYPVPRLRVRRRVETPPGAQAQADWGVFPDPVIGNTAVTLHAFHLVLSRSRMEAIVWATRQDELAWLAVHNGALVRPARGRPRRRARSSDASWHTRPASIRGAGSGAMCPSCQRPPMRPCARVPHGGRVR